MGYTLIISEKREAAERIARALDDAGRPSRFDRLGTPYYEAHHDGKRLIVVPAIGHLYTVAPAKRGFSYPVFDVKWTPSHLFNRKATYTKKYIATISELAKGASNFISGTDYDIEGEVIGYTILKYACNGKEHEAKRMTFSTLTKEELRRSYRAISHNINSKLAEAGQTRHVVDFLWGINLSRALTLAVRNSSPLYESLSTGRVQAPTLKFLADREKEILNFVPTPYWKIHARVRIDRRTYHVEYEKSRIDTEIDARKIVEKCSQKRGVISDVVIKTLQRNPPAPFNIGALQREAYALFGYTPSITLRAAERLYLEALISYPRTSSQKLPLTIDHAGILSSLSRAIENRDLITRLLATKNLKPKEGRGEDPAHPAIYPTGNLPERRLNSIDKKVFDLIVKRYMAIFGVPAVRESVTVSIRVTDEIFYLRGGRTLQKGWLEFYAPYGKVKEVRLPPLNTGTKVIFTDVQCEGKHTSPPPRYNPSSLLQLMEDQNIGTKATRADIIDTLYKRGYVIDKSMTTTELGAKIIEILGKHCPELLSVEFSRTLEERMDNIEKGTEGGRDVVEDSVDQLKTILQEFKAKERQIGLELSDALRKARIEKSIVGRCPICKTGDLLVLHSTRTGKRFVGCTNFSKGICTATFPLPQRPYQISLPKRTCKVCSWPVVSVRSRGKRFWNLCLNPDCPTKNHRREVRYLRQSL